MTTEKVLTEVAAERRRQKAKGFDADQDGFMGALDWHELIADYNGWARRMARMGNLGKAREGYVQVAAIAVAAIEAMERAADYGDGDVANQS